MNLINVAIAFLAGMISVTSPCCLPLLPGYLAYLTGLSSTELGTTRWRPVIAAALFVAGFTLVFALLGLTASAAGQLLLAHRRGLEVVSGVFIALLGLALALSGRVPLINRSSDWMRPWMRGHLWAAPIVGAAFGISWTPCIGPVLGGILALAGTSRHVGQGAVLLVVYALGLGLPFLLLSLSVHGVHRRLRVLGRVLERVRTAGGVVLVGMGVLIASGRWVAVMAPLLGLYTKAQWPPV